MSSEPHFPLAPWFLPPQHTAPWTEMEVLLRGVALGWNRMSHSSPRAGTAAALVCASKALCSWGQAPGWWHHPDSHA